MPRKLLPVCACLSLVSYGGAAAQAEDCFTPPEMRAMTIILSDLTGEALTRHCAVKHAQSAPYMAAQSERVNSYLDPMRPDANATLANKYVPFLADKADMAAAAVEPMLLMAVDEYGIGDMKASQCAEADIMIEALSTLQPAQAVDLLTVFMSRQIALDPNSDMKLCPAP